MTPRNLTLSIVSGAIKFVVTGLLGLAGDFLQAAYNLGVTLVKWSGGRWHDYFRPRFEVGLNLQALCHRLIMISLNPIRISQDGTVIGLHIRFDFHSCLFLSLKS